MAATLDHFHSKYPSYYNEIENDTFKITTTSPGSKELKSLCWFTNQIAHDIISLLTTVFPAKIYAAIVHVHHIQ